MPGFFYRAHISFLSFFLLASIPNRAFTQNVLNEISFASFNLAFAATENEYKRALASCNITNWCDPRPPISNITISSLVASDVCAGITQAAWGSEKAVKSAPPCNAYSYAKDKGIVTLQNKNKFLGETITQLTTPTTNRPGVKIFAFQEVSSEQAVREIVGANLSKDYFFCDSGDHDGVQKLAFMWHKTLGEAKCEPFGKLGISDGLRNLRPGLRLTLNKNKLPVSFLNVHLKASCASVFPDDRFAGRVLTDKYDAACKTLLRQMPPLLEWLEETNNVSPHFIMLGDFNRKIDHEKSAEDLKMIGKDALLSEEELFIKDTKPPYTVTIHPRFMWTFLSKKSPNLKGIHQLDLNQRDVDCKGFESLDHVVISGALHKIQLKPTFSVKKAVLGGDIATNEKASDHCPRVSTILIPN